MSATTGESASSAEQERHESRQLDRSLVSGLAWTGGTKWATQILSWLSTLIVARILTPTDFGLVGMATVYLGLVQLVNEFGLGSAIIQRRGLDEGQLARLGGLSVLIGVLFFGVSAIVASPLAVFFSEPAVRWIVIVLSTRFVIAGVQILPRALLQRDLQFKKLAWIDGVEAVTLTAVTLLLAVLGFRYWALVLGGVVSGVAAAAVSLSARPHRLAWPADFASIAGEVTFGWRIVVARVAWYVYSNADFAVVGRFLGSVAMGAYTFGWDIASIPVDRITGLLNRVTPAVLAKVQDDPPALQRYLRLLTEGLALATFPAAVGLALVADDFIVAAVGPQWQPAVAPLRLLAIAAAIRSITPLFDQILVATGQAQRTMRFMLVAMCVMPVLFYVGSHWGTAGVAAAWVVGYPVVVAPLFIRAALRTTRGSMGGYLKALWPATRGTALMAAAVLAVRLGMPGRWSVYVRLGVEVLAGAVVYGAVMLLFQRSRIRDLRQFLAEMRT